MKRFVAAVLLVALGIGLLIYGGSLSRQNAQNRRLLDTELQASPTPTADLRSMLLVTVDPNSPTATAVLFKVGTQNDGVKEIQTRLKELGYEIGTCDGQYGEQTANAVMAFQLQCGLTADGIVGEETYEALFKASAPTCAPTPTPEPVSEKTSYQKGDEGDGVKKLQSRLSELGYYEGETDGIFGSGTQKAVKRFQTQNGLEADGVAGSTMLELLYSEDAPYISVTPTPDPNTMPILVNRTHPIDSDYEPDDLVYLRKSDVASYATIKGSEIQGDRTAVNALAEMFKAAKEDGITGWQINAGYRSYQYQKELFDQSVSEYREKGFSQSKAESATRQTVADPGTSEHHTGLAFDVTVKGASQFKGTDQQKWLHEHCWDYGFIIRYQEDKESITGYIAECWHIRYVGLPHSQIMYENNLCLEEYLGMTD